MLRDFLGRLPTPWRRDHRPAVAVAGHRNYPTPEGQRDTQEDVLWAQSVLDRFEAEVRVRLDDDPNRLLIAERNIPKIAVRLREAIAIGAEGLYALNIAASPGSLQPLRFNDRAHSSTSRRWNRRSPGRHETAAGGCHQPPRQLQ